MTREEATSFLKERINPNIVETVLAAGGSGGPSYDTTVKFQLLDGEEYAEVGFQGEGKVGKPDDPDIPSGYTVFDGWYDEEDQKISFPFAPESAGEHTLTSKFTNGGQSLEEDSWEQIAYIAKNRLVNSYTIGDTKDLTFTYGGTDYTVKMQLVGKNHDYLIHEQDFIGDGNTTTFTINEKPSLIGLAEVLVDGTVSSDYSYNTADGVITFTTAPGEGIAIKARYSSTETAELTFISKGLPFTKKMNNSDTNVGGWKGSVLRGEMNGALFNALPQAVKSGIRTVGKIYDAGNKSTTLKTSPDNLWIPSWEEVGGSGMSYYVSGQGTSYSDIFSDNTSRIKNLTASGTGGSAQTYWMRSAYTTYTDYFWCVVTSGSSNTYTASHSYGVAVGFSM